MVEFVSYNGKWPNLCHGDLIVKIDDKEVNLGSCLVSCGTCGFRNGYSESYVLEGPWDIDEYEIPMEYRKYINEITDVVNKNVRHGCCGGCL